MIFHPTPLTSPFSVQRMTLQFVFPDDPSRNYKIMKKTRTLANILRFRVKCSISLLEPTSTDSLYKKKINTKYQIYYK